MIIELLLGVIYKIMDAIMILNIPDLPKAMDSFLNQAITYLEMGGGILANYTYLPIIFIMFGVIVAIDLGIMVYHFVMWILRKIPMAGIS